MSQPIEWKGFLCISVNKKGYSNPVMWKSTARLTTNKPAVGKDEVAVKIGVSLPVSLFIAPQLEAKITVPDAAVTPLVVEMEVLDNIRELIAQQTGFDVSLKQVTVEGGK